MKSHTNSMNKIKSLMNKNLNSAKENASNLIRKSSKKDIIFYSSIILFTIGVSTITTLLLVEKEREMEAQKASASEIKFPSLNYHYGHISNPKYKHKNSDIELYISLTSEASMKAYIALMDYKKSNQVTYKIMHLAQNPEWETAARVYHSITNTNPNADLLPLFQLFISDSKPSDLSNKLSDYLTENNIDSEIFNENIKSIDTLSKINNDIRLSRNADIDFIPTMIIFSKYYVYFGSFKSYEDSFRLIDTLKGK